MKFFILGSNPTLSVAEIAAVVGRNNDYSKASSEALILDNIDIPSDRLQDRLAGVKKVGGIIGSVKTYNKDELAELIASLIQGEGKQNFGVSVYDLGNSELADELAGEAKALGLETKKLLKKRGVSSRLVTSRDRELSSVVVEKNNLLSSGGEFALFATPSEILIGQTETIQDFEAWSKRDFGRPARDAKSGMLPPKLARTLVNLTGANYDDVFLDPFCGSGTILMEARMMGFQHIAGSDISKKAIKDSRQNLEWLAEEFGRDVEDIDLVTIGAQDLELEELADAIATEPYLGPPQRGQESDEQLSSIINELADLYKETFSNLATLMKQGATLITVFPVFRGERYVPVLNKLKDAGLELDSLLPESLPEELKKQSPRGGIVYRRKGQRVAREILKFVKQ